MVKQENDYPVVYISGPLDFDTVPVLNASNRSLIAQTPQIVFDLSQVTTSDNTGVALLVALTSYAKGVGKKITYINLPQQLLELIQACGVREMLPLVS